MGGGFTGGRWIRDEDGGGTVGWLVGWLVGWVKAWWGEEVRRREGSGCEIEFWWLCAR